MTPELRQSPRLEAEARSLGVRLGEARLLAGDGSDRLFFRLPGEPTAVLLYHPRAPGREVTENDSYVFIGRHLRSRGVPVPEIYAYCREEGWLLLEDVGEVSLAEAVAGGCGQDGIEAFYRQALEILVQQQIEGSRGFNPAWCFDTPTVTRQFLRERECGYFLEAFVRGYLGLEVAEAEVAPEFERLLEGARPEEGRFFLHRDFQSKNLFVQEKGLRVLDFQGGRLGPLGYDAAALLIDPYVDLSPARQEAFLGFYLDLLEKRLVFDRREFKERYEHLALCRNLQILGAFGFLTRVKGKPQFERYIPPALAGLRRRLQARRRSFPRLLSLVEGISL